MAHNGTVHELMNLSRDVLCWLGMLSCALSLMVVTGCKHIGPQTVAVDRFD